MGTLKHLNYIKKVHSVNLDTGIVKKAKEILKRDKYQESFSSLMDKLLDQWCKDKDNLYNFVK